MTDRGIIESIAEELCGDPKYHGSEHIADARRILDRLTADGYSVVKAEVKQVCDHTAMTFGGMQCIRCGAVRIAETGVWVPGGQRR